MSTAIETAAPARRGGDTRPRLGPWRREIQAFVELFAVCGMAIARPTLGILGNNAEIFVTRQTRPAELVGLTLFLVLAPPLVLWLLEAAIGAAAPSASPRCTSRSWLSSPASSWWRP